MKTVRSTSAPPARWRSAFAATAALVLLATAALAAPATAQPAPPSETLRLLNEISFESKQDFEGTIVGGLSGLAFDARRNVYYAVCDDRGEFGPARFYTLRIDMTAAGIRAVQTLGYTVLDSDADTPGIQPYEPNDTDLEELVLLPNDELLISSERDRTGRPWVRRFALDGTLLEELPTPAKFLPVTQTNAAGQNVIVRGVRTNLGFEGLALSPDGMTLYTANEEALAQDGPIATTSAGTNVRVLRLDNMNGTWVAGPEYVYRAERIFATPVPAGQFGDNGVSGMLWVRHILPEYDFLAMERSFASGVGNDVNIYGVTVGPAQNVASQDALGAAFSGRMVTKTLLVNMASIGIAADNLEAMALGPRLPNGKLSLIAMSDDNFSAFNPPQVNQFVAFEINTAPVGK